MKGWVTTTVAALRREPATDWAARLAAAQARQLREVQPAQLESWLALIHVLQGAFPDARSDDWAILLECDLLRLEKRIDTVVLTDRAILVIEFKHNATGFSPQDAAQAEDYALDLRDFHAACRQHPIVPILLASAAPSPRNDWPLLWHGVTSVLRASAESLPALLAEIQSSIPAPDRPLDAMAWMAAPYHPVPTIVEAAQRLFARHGVEEIATSRTDAINLGLTTTAIRRAIDQARADGARCVVFVTGIPGAGKTLCGLNLVFGTHATEGAAFLTGNAPLVAVLRGALLLDATKQGRSRRQPGRETRTLLQNVHRFLEYYVREAETAPSEHVVVFDEAQRAWDADQAGRDTQRRRSILTTSEPAHMLEIMHRVPGWSVIVALIGNGQEINTGEAGLAEWGRVVARSGGSWRAVAAPATLQAIEPAQRLAEGQPDWLTLDPDLNLAIPIRSVLHDRATLWVDAVLNDRPKEAAEIAAAGRLPFFVTRDLNALRTALRSRVRGLRRAGLVCSSKARRLRAEGLGVQLHGADDEVVNWFLRRWPDIRASDALEVCATEYSCQGLELDMVGMAWGGDFIREAGHWQARRFSGTRWNRVSQPEMRRYIRNTYRVLLTRARYDTVILIPPGHAEDATRSPQEANAIASYLQACGVRPVEELLPCSDTPAPQLL